jgi:hypothetical protein
MPVDDDFTIPVEEKDGSHPAGGAGKAAPLGATGKLPSSGVQVGKPTGTVSPVSAAKVIKSALEAGRKTDFKRPVNLNGQGATRCRMFHCKVAESSMDNMENQINDWLDSGQIEVKQVGHVVGMMEGKHTEPNVIVIVWY